MCIYINRNKLNQYSILHRRDYPSFGLFGGKSRLSWIQHSLRDMIQDEIHEQINQTKKRKELEIAESGDLFNDPALVVVGC